MNITLFLLSDFSHFIFLDLDLEEFFLLNYSRILIAFSFKVMLMVLECLLGARKWAMPEHIACDMLLLLIFSYYFDKGLLCDRYSSRGENLSLKRFILVYWRGLCTCGEYTGSKFMPNVVTESFQILSEKTDCT